MKIVLFLHAPLPREVGPQVSLEDLLHRYSTARQHNQHEDAERSVRDARRLLPVASEPDWETLTLWLQDDERKWFVAAVFSKAPVPKRLFEPFILAAIHEKNPSFNRQFVEPCIHAWGHRRVNERLLDCVEGGSNAEIAGAVAALYWANMQIAFKGDVPAYTLDHATPESRSAYLELNDIWKRKRRAYLTTFVQNSDLDVRRQIIPRLKLEADEYPDDLKPLVVQAIDIARNHDDDYIRHRLEVQLGHEKLLKPIPERK